MCQELIADCSHICSDVPLLLCLQDKSLGRPNEREVLVGDSNCEDSAPGCHQELVAGPGGAILGAGTVTCLLAACAKPGGEVLPVFHTSLWLQWQ